MYTVYISNIDSIGKYMQFVFCTFVLNWSIATVMIYTLSDFLRFVLRSFYANQILILFFDLA